jgi:glutamate carboxypeptidase
MAESITAQAQRIAASALRELDALVGVSSPSGDVAGAEEAIAICAALLPAETVVERVPCSTAESAPDLVATISGTGEGRLLLLGHVDTATKPTRRCATPANGCTVREPPT